MNLRAPFRPERLFGSLWQCGRLIYKCVYAANRNRPVGKRTPRFQTGIALEKRVRTIKGPVSKLPNRVEEDSDSDVAAARTLVSKQTASPSASNTPSRRSLRQTSLHQNGDKVLLLCYSSASKQRAS